VTGGYGWNAVNGTWTVTAATTTTFTITGVDTFFFPIQGTANSGGTATVNDTTANDNPAIINMAVLGNCPSGTQKNFGPTSNDPISYVYMNEVATAAAANALAAFGSDAFHIGIPASDSLALTNIENAANNANQLYDIEGANISGTFDGEGHIANQYTPGSYVNGSISNYNYGLVDQAKLDTLGNILASCVDSTNTYGKGFTSGTTSSANCLTLFQNATSTGAPSTNTPGTSPVPEDIATAAFNIAHHPSGTPAASGTYASNLLALQGTVYPFYPSTDSVDDFTIGITYYAVGLNSPQGIAIDSIGDAFITNDYQDPNGTTGHYLVGLSPLGVPLTNSPFGVPGARTAALDTSGNIWSTGQDAYFYKIPIGSGPGVYGSSVTAYPFDPNGQPSEGISFGLAIDNSGNVDVTSLIFPGVLGFNSSTGNYDGYYYNAGGVANDYITIASSGNIWTDSNYEGNYIVEQNGSGLIYKSAAITGSPQPFAVDGNGTAWVPVYNAATATYHGYVAKVTAGGTLTNITSGGGIDGPSASAVDGSGYIWIANQTNQTVSEFTGSGTAVTGANAYRILDTIPGSNFDGGNVAIDGSGDVWVAFNGSYTGNSITALEIIGAASPVVTPLVTATKNSELGMKP
jgi:hypothetical protein